MAVVVSAVQRDIWNCQDDVCQVPPTGVIFVKEREIVVTGDVWTITSDIDSDNFFQLHKALTDALKDTTGAIAQIGVASLSREIGRINDKLDKIYVKLSSINMLSTPSELGKQKRGLINIAGTGLKYLFGTMDDNDLKRIKGQIDQLADMNAENIHLEAEQ